jgi:hypothetical protein
MMGGGELDEPDEYNEELLSGCGNVVAGESG